MVFWGGCNWGFGIAYGWRRGSLVGREVELIEMNSTNVPPLNMGTHEGAPTPEFGGSFSFGYCVLKGHPRGVPRHRILDCDFPSSFALRPSSLKKKKAPSANREGFFISKSLLARRQGLLADDQTLDLHFRTIGQAVSVHACSQVANVEVNTVFVTCFYRTYEYIGNFLTGEVIDFN